MKKVKSVNSFKIVSIFTFMHQCWQFKRMIFENIMKHLKYLENKREGGGGGGETIIRLPVKNKKFCLLHKLFRLQYAVFCTALQLNSVCTFVKAFRCCSCTVLTMTIKFLCRKILFIVTKLSC